MEHFVGLVESDRDKSGLLTDIWTCGGGLKWCWRTYYIDNGIDRVVGTGQFCDSHEEAMEASSDHLKEIVERIPVLDVKVTDRRGGTPKTKFVTRMIGI